MTDVIVSQPVETVSGAPVLRSAETLVSQQPTGTDTAAPVEDITPPSTTQPLGIAGGDRFAAGGGLTETAPAPMPEVAAQSSSYGDIFDAMLKSTPTANAVRAITEPLYPADPHYNPLEDPQIKGTTYEQSYLSNFVTSQSAAESASIIREINAENGRNLTFARGGITGIAAGMAAGLLDPTMLIPVGGWVKGGVAVGRASRLLRAADAAIGVGLATSAQEAVLQSTMETRTGLESGVAIGGGILLGAVLGAASRGLSRAESDRLAAVVEEHMNAPEGDLGAPGAAGAQISEARGSGLQRAALGDVSFKIGDREFNVGVGRALKFLTPKSRVQESELRATRLTAADLIAGNALEENYSRGVASSEGGSVESRVAATAGDINDILQNNRALYAEYRFGKQVALAPTRAMLSKLAGQSDGKMSFLEFRQAVTDAWLAGDQHAIPQVAAAAKYAREKGFNPPRDEAIGLGMPGYEEGMAPQSGDKGYMPRHYNKPAIIAKGDDFNRVVMTGLKRAQATSQARLETWRQRQTSSLQAQIADLELSGESRASTLASLEAEQKALREGPGKGFAPIDARLEALRSNLAAQRTAGNRAGAAATTEAVKAEVDRAGQSYADYVTKRNALASRLRRIRGNVVGRENQVEALRAKIADVENANVDRLYRMHAAITKLEARIQTEGPEGVAAELDDLRTQFANVLERSQKAQERVAAAREKARAQLAEHLAPAGEAPPKIDVGPNPELSMAKRPVLDMLKARGGVDPDSTLAAELRHIGVTSQSAPGLFKAGGRGAADNIVASETDLFRHLQTSDGYVPESEILDAVREEMAGQPRRTPEQLQAIDEHAARVEHNAGARQDMASLKADAALKRMEARDAARLAEISDLADRIGERESFDAEGATAELRTLIERRLAQSAQVVEDAGRHMLDLTERLKKANPDLVRNRVAALKDRMRAVENRPGSQLAEMSDQELANVAEGIRNSVLGLSPSRMALPNDLAVAGPRGPLKERVMNFVTTQELKPFLHWDSEELLSRYMRTMNTDINLIRKFGSTDMKEQIQKIIDEGNALKVGKSEKEQARINKMIQHDVRDIAAMRDILRGTYRLPEDPNGLLHRGLQASKTLNFLSSLGMMTVSSVSDLAKPVFVHGLTRNMRTFFAPFTRGMKAYNLARRDVKAAGVGIDMIAGDRVMALNELAQQHASNTMFERGLQKAGRAFGFLTLMNPWNATLKQFTGVITISRALEDIEAMVTGKIGAKERGYLAEGGISENLASRIQAEVEKHGGMDGGVRWAGTGAWTDMEAKRALHAFVNRDVDRVIVSPGIGDKPLRMHGDLGSMIGQFQSFAIASVQHTLVAGLQQKDMAAFNGMMLMLAWGALSYKLKSDLAGIPTADPSTENGLAQWAAEALDNSGVLGVLMNADHALEKITSDRIGLSALTGKPFRRYSNVNTMGAFLGPSFGKASDILDVVSAAFRGNMTQSDIHKVRKMVPLQNLAWARFMFNAAESGINQSFGVPQTRQ